MYRDRVIPTLESIEGCRYAGMLQSVHEPDSCVSLTLWNAEQHARAYESSGLFAKLLEEMRPVFSESSESQIRLSENLTLEYVPIPQEPVVSTQPVAASSRPQHGDMRAGGGLWVRIVSLKLRPGKREEFKRVYAEQAIPVLRQVKGCRYVYLAEHENEPDAVLSVTSWDSREDAENYEKSGTFDRLLESQKSYLSSLYQWKRERGTAHKAEVATSEDVLVDHFNVLVGKSFDAKGSDQ
jgi:heme-degrading monooxygenase HmoA